MIHACCSMSMALMGVVVDWIKSVGKHKARELQEMRRVSSESHARTRAFQLLSRASAFNFS